MYIFGHYAAIRTYSECTVDEHCTTLVLNVMEQHRLPVSVSPVLNNIKNIRWIYSRSLETYQALDRVLKCCAYKDGLCPSHTAIDLIPRQFQAGLVLCKIDVKQRTQI